MIAFVDHKAEKCYAVQNDEEDAMHIQATVQGVYGGNVDIVEHEYPDAVYDAFCELLAMEAFHGCYQVIKQDMGEI